MRTSVALVVAAVLFCAAEGRAGYDLFHPVPHDELRPFATDRPDITESPLTVDAGHFQLEADILRWQKDRRAARTSHLVVWSALYKLGLTDSIDLQAGFESYDIEQDRSGRTVARGIGALILRGKWNLYGNDGTTRTALGLLPYIGFPNANPSAGYAALQYGLGVPFALALTETLGLGAQAQLDVLPEREGHRIRVFQSLVLDGELVGPVRYFVEGVVSFSHSTNLLFDGGFIFAIAEDVAADVAANIGVNESAPIRFYLGLSFRI